MPQRPHVPHAGNPPSQEAVNRRRAALQILAVPLALASGSALPGEGFDAWGAAAPSRFTTLEGSPLHYLDLGRGPAVLLGHSYLWDASMWAPQIRALSRHFRVIVPELWGHGASGPLPGNTQDLQGLAAQMLALLDALRIRECAVVGLSVGGMWGAELALQAPGRVRSLVMMDTYLGAEPEATRQRYFGMLDAIEAAGQITPALVNAIVPIFFRPGTDPSAPRPAAFARSLAAMTAEQLRQSVVPLGRIIFGRADALDRLGALDPRTTLLMGGDEDIPRPPHEMQEMAEVIGCESVLIPTAGHISNQDNPEFVTRHLLHWLGRTMR
ncbi:Pimeloyl-ACP methyl ester carboxylesterase [Paracidovorax anthurii]|uniref:Pimeloyl-ACP methyl ester carboxylesterase n=1 Tax=Paracidovorax anthurii TaxID=78229 RepID=A0A328Z9H8_9BURK|nr:alpha/beta fold hydrolase [Paracidovorax anthurii]RAR82830.1 pimeloyl-ACP methyl ester carboxylesterase [Paracidovorax anthurii]